MAENGDLYKMPELSEEEAKRIRAQRERSDKISSLMGQKLLMRWRMLATYCDQCGVRANKRSLSYMDSDVTVFYVRDLDATKPSYMYEKWSQGSSQGCYNNSAPSCKLTITFRMLWGHTHTHALHG